MAFDTDILGQLRSRRRIMLEIFLVAALLGLMLNLFSNILYDELSGKAERLLGLHVLVWAGIFLVGIVFILAIFIRERDPYELRFRIVLPFSGREGDISILPIPAYMPSMKANSVLESVLKHHPDEGATILEQLGLAGGKPGRGDGYRFASVEKTIITLLLSMLKLHCEHTQTQLGRYHLKYADSCQRLETASFDVEPEALFGYPLPLLPRRIKLPHSVSLSLGGHEKRPSSILLASQYASLKISILPHWTIIAQEKSLKTYLVVTRNLAEKAVLLTIPIKMVVRVHYRALWNFREADDHCDWMELLLNEIWQWFDWDHYMQGDQERLLVELYHAVKERV